MAVGLGIAFVGYWLAYFGYCSLRGPGVGLLDLVIPGRDVTIPGGAGAANLGPGGERLPFPRVAPTPGNPTPSQNPTVPYVPGKPKPAPWPGGGAGDWYHQGNKWVWIENL